MKLLGFTVVKTKELDKELERLKKEIHRLRGIEGKYKELTDRDDKGRFIKKEQ